MDIQEIRNKYGVSQSDAAGVADTEAVYKKASDAFKMARQKKSLSDADVKRLKSYYYDLQKRWKDVKDLADKVHTLYFDMASFMEKNKVNFV